MHRPILFLAVPLLALAACADQPVTPAARLPDAAALAAGGSAVCAKSPDAVAGSEAALLAALAAAAPGDVIALDGFFAVGADVLVTTDGVTLTCATPGSGLFAATGAGVVNLIFVGAKDVTVSGLVLDARETLDGPYFAYNNGFAFDAERAALRDVRARCGPGTCAFIVGVPGAVVADSRFESGGSTSGIQLQGQGPALPYPRPIDGARIERNTVVATAPSTGPAFGGIRVRDGRGVIVEHNVVVGPWASSLAPTMIRESRFASNRLEGAASFGIRFATSQTLFPSVLDNLFRGNRVTGAGVAGVSVRLACGNAFVGNDLQGNAGNVGASFEPSTGANVLAGNGTLVLNAGALDCDGDGSPDPNVITGPGRTVHGSWLGGEIGGAMTGPAGRELH